MAYNEYLEERIQRVLKDKKVPFEAKKMMGGMAFMVNEKMCVGIIKNDLMARIDPEIYEECLQKPGCRPMDFTKQKMKGFVFVTADAIDMDADLEGWIQLALEFNPKAKKSKK